MAPWRAMLLASACSGAAALIYELLLFERARLILGSSVTAGAWVLGAWMLGLALGASLGRWRGLPAWSRRRYAELEVVVVLLLCAAVLPGTQIHAAPFMALIVTASALLGLSTPLLVQLGLGARAQFVGRIRWLYAANTAGAVVGALLGLVMLRQAGVHAALVGGLAGSLLAAGLVLLWAVPAAAVSTHRPLSAAEPQAGPSSVVALAALAAALGFLLLWAEVLSLRMLPFFARGTAENFALVVAVVIAGLSLGAMLPPRWRHLAGYGALLSLVMPWCVPAALPPLAETLRAASVAVLWLLPLAVISGCSFSALCEQARAAAPHSGHAIGTLGAFNALGAALGALLGGLLLLPLLGVQSGWVLLCSLLMLLSQWLHRRSMAASAWLGPWVSLTVVLVFCLSQPGFLEQWRERATAPYVEQERVAALEAVDADHVLLRNTQQGTEPSWRLLTDGYSMSNTAWDSQRYMRLFAALPQLLHPQLESALLISYGLGNTARQLLLDQRLQQLTVADISEATIDFARRVDPAPLADARTDLHIEDGRQLLRRNPGRFDLITAEPPPPRLAGIQNLYSAEYFTLAHAALRPGGFVSHWLPVDQLSAPSTRAIVAAFCAAFADCSLWSGSHYNWMLLGSRAAIPTQRWPVYSQAAWRSSVARIGIEQAWQWPALFLADAGQLAAWSAQSPRLSDDHPGRLQSRAITPAELQGYFLFADELEAQRRLQQSPWAQRWVVPLGQKPAAWLWQPILDGRSRPAEPDLPLLAVASLVDGLRLPLLRLFGLSPGQLDGPAAVTDGLLGGLQLLFQAQPGEAALRLAQSADPRAALLEPVARCLAGLADCPQP